MNSNIEADNSQPSTLLIRVDSFTLTRPREKCRVTLLDAETSSVIATRSFDVGFVRQASLSQLMNIMSVGYRRRCHCVEEATRALRLSTRNVSRALAHGTQRETQLKDSIENANFS